MWGVGWDTALHHRMQGKVLHVVKHGLNQGRGGQREVQQAEELVESIQHEIQNGLQGI